MPRGKMHGFGKSTGMAYLARSHNRPENMQLKPKLPPGQREIAEMPRFGLPKYASRFPAETERVAVVVCGDVEHTTEISDRMSELRRVEQVTDFHCVTSWTKRAVGWTGYRFSDFYEQLVRPAARPESNAGFVIFRCQDGYRVSLPLGDLMSPDVLLADEIDGQPLSIKHGAPLRLVAPAHYGYKNPKHIKQIEFWRDDRNYRQGAFAFMDHPRGRVAHEERGRIFPGWLLRYLYRPLINPVKRRFAAALATQNESAR